MIIASTHNVLIETYWNVKIVQNNQVLNYILVLIETYWNVKCVLCDCCRRDCCVLIETYWNVKFFKFRLLLLPLFCINRNILECKAI